MSEKEYIAHLTSDGRIQSVAEHLKSTADMAANYSIDELKEANYLCGMLHDIGKYTYEFQRHIRGENVRAEHSICGAKEAPKYIGKKDPLCFLIQLCIAGHHTGIPDCGTMNDTEYMPTLYGRLKRVVPDYSDFANDITAPEINSDSFKKLLTTDCATREDLVEKFAFLVRYCFSCLTDADSLDTRAFCEEKPIISPRFDYSKCISALDEKLSGFKKSTQLQAARQKLQLQAFEKISSDSNVYIMNMPTGSGKTLASMRCALERIKKSEGKLKRIIYVIPYNSIIDQTAREFEGLFSPHTDVIRHQSSFAYEERDEYSEDYRSSAIAACENWDAGIIITTAVQFFESLYGNKRGKLRKVHNMANSVIVFDEAHLMPREYLEPCLRGISYISKYLNSEALLLTATMPDFRTLFQNFSETNLRITDLIEDKSDFGKFRKCRFGDLGAISQDELINKASYYASSLIVVNSKKKAAELYELCSGEKYHLSTYMTAYDRECVIARISSSLKRLRIDFPNLNDVPPERRICVISTSLIEAGVDLDFNAAFRELAGLDSVLQTGGRCNREGYQNLGDVFVFESDKPKLRKIEQELTKGLFSEYEDISCEEAISAYYARLFGIEKEKLQANTISLNCKSINLIPFRTYSESFRLIDDKRTVSIAVCRDEYSRGLYDKLCITGNISSRKIRRYCCTVYLDEFENLMKQGVLDDRGSGIYFLINPLYYNEEIGITFEGKDIFI